MEAKQDAPKKKRLNARRRKHGAKLKAEAAKIIDASLVAKANEMVQTGTLGDDVRELNRKYPLLADELGQKAYAKMKEAGFDNINDMALALAAGDEKAKEAGTWIMSVVATGCAYQNLATGAKKKNKVNRKESKKWEQPNATYSKR